ncbi:hypothetical protein D3C76_1172110 [compost metagenome]
MPAQRGIRVIRQPGDHTEQRAGLAQLHGQRADQPLAQQAHTVAVQRRSAERVCRLLKHAQDGLERSLVDLVADPGNDSGRFKVDAQGLLHGRRDSLPWRTVLQMRFQMVLILRAKVQGATELGEALRGHGQRLAVRIEQARATGETCACGLALVEIMQGGREQCLALFGA